jgi:hypothetical protein
MGRKRYLKIEDKLLEAQVVLDNAAADLIIAPAIAVYGYGAAKMAEGKAVYRAAFDAHRKQIAEYGEKYDATESLHKAWEKAHAVFRGARLIARIALRDNKRAAVCLQLSGSIKESVTGWLDQASVFYSNLLSEPDFLESMEPFTYDRKRLLSEQALVNAVAEARNRQDKESGEAQQATQERDERIDGLGIWIHDLREVARLALEDSPQQLEKLGITV